MVDRYPASDIIAVDNAPNMVEVAQQKPGFSSICADAYSLPFSDWYFQAIYSNLLLQWLHDYNRAFSEIRRVLCPGGYFIFSTFGPSTLQEVRQSWAGVDNFKHVNDFVDMQELAQLLAKKGFIDVVVSRESMVVKYSSIKKIFTDLRSIGATNVTAMNKFQGLMTQAKLTKFFRNYDKLRLSDGTYPLTYEIVYGIAWAKESGSGAVDDHIVSVDHLRNLMKKFKNSVEV